jgi:transposase-like protein
MATNGSLTAKQRRMIACLLTAASVQAAAKAAGVGERTAYRWMRQPEFMAELDAATKDAIAQTVRRLASLSVAATGVLGATMADGTRAERLRAANVTLGRLPQLAQLFALEERLATIEAALAAGGEHAKSE